MGKINKNNYEKFALDYLENSLDATTKREFELFVELNPEIKAELEGILDFSVLPTDCVFDLKDELKKSEIEGLNLYEFLCISDIENTITASQKDVLSKIFKENPNLLSEYSCFAKTKLKADDNVVIDDKCELKQSGINDISYVDYLLISYVEGRLSELEQVDFEKIIKKDDRLASDLELYKKTKLLPENVSLPFGKNELKASYFTAHYAEASEKRNRKKILFFAYPLAAMLVLFLGVKLFFNQKEFITGAYEYNFVVEPRLYVEQQPVIVPETKIETETETEVRYYVSDNQSNKVDEVVANDFDILTEETLEKEQVVIAYNDDLRQKNIEYKLSNFEPENVDIELFDVRYNDLIDSGLEDRRIAVKNTQKVLNFVVKQFNKMTENELSVKLDVNENKNCYVVGISDKNYTICLDNFKKFKRE